MINLYRERSLVTPTYRAYDGDRYLGRVVAGREGWQADGDTQAHKTKTAAARALATKAMSHATTI